jgi:hypothetical protein
MTVFVSTVEQRRAMQAATATAWLFPRAVTLAFAQNTANASDTYLKIGSWMQLTKVA